MDTRSVSALTEAAASLAPRLRNLDIENSGVSDYTKRYYKDYLRKLDYALKSILQLLTAAVNESGKAVSESIIIDHGGGIGIISFLCAEAGFSKVIYSDIFKPAAEDAKVLASLLNVSIDHYHAGEITGLATEMQEKNLSADILVSRNVIEHIYDLEGFFQSLDQIPSNELTLAFSTTANYHNPLTLAYTERLQKKAELEGLKGKWEKSSDRGVAYLKVREQILKEAFPKMPEKERTSLAKATRGLIRKDIISEADKFTSTNVIPRVKVLRSNTCDPLTGNRAENLIPVSHYKELFYKHGYSFSVDFGLYNEHYSSRLINMVTPLANRLIKKSKLIGLRLAPFLIFSGKKK